jgi:glycosyltransferase involved in cell wall biosynthesis
VRILLWHGYLLGGTGSNVYTRALARAWAKLGHDVVVFSQERHPDGIDVGGAEVVRPRIDGVLPVFVLDRYEGLEARLLQDTTPAERKRYVEANAAALREHLPADLVFANHVLLGGPVAAATGAPFAIKAHGSELEYSIRGNPDLVTWARESLASARAVYVGSAHIREVLEDVLGHVDHVYEVPPGVDVEEFRPADRAPALEALLAECRRDPPNPANRNERLPDEGNEQRLGRWFEDDRPTVIYFGKLLLNKGVHVLFEALRDFRTRGEQPPRAVVVGFGDYRAHLEALAPEGTLFTGALEHRHLAHLLPLCDVCVVPSIFPEAFGMVAAEAAAAGCPPLVAHHSGLAEVAEGLRSEYPGDLRFLVSFTTGDAAGLSLRIQHLLDLPADTRDELRSAARRAAERLWSWESVALRLLEPFRN